MDRARTNYRKTGRNLCSLNLSPQSLFSSRRIEALTRYGDGCPAKMARNNTTIWKAIAATIVNVASAVIIAFIEAADIYLPL